MNAPEMHTEVMELARAKLVASRAIDSSYDTFPRIARMAVLDVQLSLDYEPRREKVQIEEAGLVESHMRIAYSIPNDREYLRSGYPSEPLLAEAAARQLWKWRTQDPFVVVNTLTNILDTGLLDRGELGELTGRHLLLDAYHQAVELEQRGRPEKTPPISVPAVVLSPSLICYTMMGARRWFLTALRTISMGSLFERHSRMLSFVSLTSGKWRMILA